MNPLSSQFTSSQTTIVAAITLLIVCVGCGGSRQSPAPAQDEVRSYLEQFPEPTNMPENSVKRD